MLFKYLMASWLLVNCGADFSPTQQTSQLHDFSSFDESKKLQDFYSIISIIDEHYAMVDYKEKRFNFSWADKKEEFKNRILDPQVGRKDFEKIIQEMVALFADGHVSASLGRSSYLEDPSITTLGFLTKYDPEQDIYVIDQVLPHIFSHSPFQSGDQILEFNSRSIEDVVQEDILKYTNTGRERANKNIAASLLTMRLPHIFSDIPEGITHVKVKRQDTIIEREVPWLHLTQTDIFFMLFFGQNDSYKTITKKSQDGFQTAVSNRLSGILNLMNNNHTDLKIAASIPALIASSIQKSADQPDFYKRSESYQDLNFELFPMGQGWAAIYRIEDFVNSRLRCQGKDCKIINGETYANAFSQLKNQGVHTLILDLRSNGGGYLQAGYELLRAFKKDTIDIGLTEIRLNEEWMQTFRNLSETPLIPYAERHEWRESYQTLLEDAKEEKKISRPVSIVGSKSLEGVSNPWEGETLILIDDMCASMCDIFTVAMQDLDLATVVGSQSMGAGGNVIGFQNAAPNQKISLSITASRILRLDGSLIENEGAHPDIETVLTKGPSFWDTVIQVGKDLMNKNKSVATKTTPE